MLKKIVLPSILILLGYGFWVSPDFKEIAAGVSIFLFGMLSLEEGFKSFTGGTLEKILRKTTDKRWKSLTFGIVSTTLMQSSSLVSVITISFLSAGLLGLAQGIGIIFGANIGTTTGAWLVAGFGLKVKISAYAMPMLVFGVIMVFQKSTTLKGIGYILAGLGFLFLGIHHMKEGFEAFKSTIDLSEFAVGGFGGLLLYCAIGIFATVVMQSSHATMVLIITALAAGQVTYDNALALAIGANIGTTITAIIGALSANEQGKRLAGAHLIFNVATGLIAIVFIQQFMLSVDYASAVVGIADDDYTLKLAVFHTIFNLVGVIVMLPFIDNMVVFLTKTIKPKTAVIGKVEPLYLAEASVDYPDTAVKAVKDETMHIYDQTLDVIAGGLHMQRSDLVGDSDLGKVFQNQKKLNSYNIQAHYELKVKGLYSAVIAFISRAAFTWKEEQSGSLHWLRDANRNMVESVKAVKHLQRNLEHYVVSDHPEMRAKYNQIRANIADVVRGLEPYRHPELLDEGDDEISLLSLDALKLMMDVNEKEFSESLFSLIHQGKISAEMGSSLMNDMGYANDAARNLIEMGMTLFVHQTEEITSAERELSLDDDELAKIT